MRNNREHAYVVSSERCFYVCMCVSDSWILTAVIGVLAGLFLIIIFVIIVLVLSRRSVEARSSFTNFIIIVIIIIIIVYYARRQHHIIKYTVKTKTN